MRRYPAYRDSGLPWLGDIPAHWKSIRLKRFASVVLGKMLQPEPEPGYVYKSYLRAANVQWEKTDISDVKSMWFSRQELAELRIAEGDLLVSEGGEVGRTCIWRGELEECYVQNSVHKVTCGSNANPNYFLHQFAVMGHSGFFESISLSP